MENHKEYERKSPVEQLQKKPTANEFFIVGIGASAGGIGALQEFFRRVPIDSDMAYVVILHLSPDHDSQLAAVLQRETQVPVAQVTQRVRIYPNHIYVVPPNQHLTMEGESIAVSTNILMEERRAPVDIFFRTLADEHGPRAVAVILSGTGANGSMGLKRIKERGGACFVQNPREAQFNEMSRNAIATEMVDEVLPVGEIPAKLMTYKKSVGSIEIVEDAEKRPEDQQQALRDIFTQIRVKTGHDFSNYKRPTLLRRLERRINIRSLPDLPSYAKFLHENPDEINFLIKDLLISVTNFFRDKKAFDAVEQEILPLLFKAKNNEGQVRIWVAGCATGEEAYSLAMLCAERTVGVIDAPKVQIFATDIDDSSIAHARDGLYTLNDLADVSPERLRHFFIKEGECFRIRREIRETIMFANHNFLKDPPFSHLDMVSCRNVMIYLNQVAQERVLETFHFSLTPGSFLFLGSSESVDGATDLYAAYNRENHIFQSRQVSPRAYPIPESTPALYFDKFKSTSVSQQQENKVLARISFGDLHQQLLEQYAPPSIIVSEEYDILHLTERAGKYLQVGGGEISQNLLKLVRTELRLELRSALYQAIQRESAVVARSLKVNTGAQTEVINIHVRPVLRLGDTAKGFILIVFEPSAEDAKPGILLSSDEPVARQLEEELIRVKMHLRASNEQHDFQAEEMKAANEELQAMNEELRSAAEELETSKEEMQSINEELRTVNQELKVKVEETSITSNNLQNLINSTDIGTIFLDRSLRVAFFTPAIATIFNLIPADYGRPLTDITHKLDYVDLLTDAESVINKLNPLEREVNTTNGMIYLLRITPYRTDDDRIKGVVITFVDITERKKSEDLIRTSEAQLRALVENLPGGAVFIIDKDLRFIIAEGEALSAAGLRSENLINQITSDSLPAELLKDFEPNYLKALAGESFEFEHQAHDHTFVSRGTPLTNSKGEVYAALAISYNITERKKTEEALAISEEKLRVTMETAVDFAIITMNSQREVQQWNTGAERIFGYSALEMQGQLVDVIFTEEDQAAGAPMQETGTAAREGFAVDERWHKRNDGSRVYMSGVMRPIYKADISGYVKVARDMTQQKQSEEQLKIFEERNRIALQSAEMAAWDWSLNRNKVVWNEQHYYLFGLIPENTEKDAAFFMQFVHQDDKENIKKELTQAVELSGIYKAEFRIIRADNNEVRWMSGFGRAIEWQGEKASRMVGVMFDITDRKKLEQQKEDFLSIASHELKTPVTSIQAYGELLEQTFADIEDETSVSLLQKMNAQVRRLNHLISDLLDTTKIFEGQLALVWEDFNLTELIAQLVEELQQLSTKHSLIIVGASTINVHADKKRIEQVITNLISNAMKYSPEGGPIVIDCEINQQEIQISITDKGIGIPKDAQEKVFSRFYRIQQGQVNTQPGMGLGLFISAGIISRHGGTINVDSSLGKGSKFYFTLPVKK